ncbi:MAG: hypothetical protein AAF968_03080, partial [Pseudomonadota bacterium]
ESDLIGTWLHATSSAWATRVGRLEMREIECVEERETDALITLADRTLHCHDELNLRRDRSVVEDWEVVMGELADDDTDSALKRPSVRWR